MDFDFGGSEKWLDEPFVFWSMELSGLSFYSLFQPTGVLCEDTLDCLAHLY